MDVGRAPHCAVPRGTASALPDRTVSRSATEAAVADLVTRASAAPAALVVSGEAGMGKTTTWLAGVSQARECGFAVLSARADVGESALAHASLADLLSGVDPDLCTNLPLPQQRALDLILLRDNSCDAEPNLRAAGTAVLSVVQRLAETSPVLLAIDDLQWLDPASANILSFVTRRLSGPVGVLATVRINAGSSCAAAGHALGGVPDLQRITLAPLTLGSLHTMLSKRLGRSLPRPTLVRIHDIAGGNPFYALELALAMDGTTASDLTVLPSTLIEVVRTQIGALGADVEQVLLAAAALAAPTVGLVAHALGAAPADVLGLLESAEDAGILRIDGDRLRFLHPLLARGIYCGASPARRRRLHSSLAGGIVEPELRARHLALGSATADPRIVGLLDSAAQSARLRGAHATAAELLDLAVGLGGDTPTRRIGSAACHFAAGDVRRARAVLEEFVARLTAGAQWAHALPVLARIHMFDDSFTAAAELLRQGLAESADRSTVRVQMLVAQAFTQVNTGAMDAAIGSTESAVAEATELGETALLSQALGMQVVLALLRGDGLDELAMQRAMRLDDRGADSPVPFLASMNHALLQAWSGHLHQARVEIEELGRRSRERGHEHEQLYVGFHSAWIEVWRGDFPAASELARDVTERAEQLGGDIPLAMAAATQASLDAYAGRVQDARTRGRAALEVSRRCGANALSRSVIATLAFLESSLGDHSAVAALVEPLLTADAEQPRATEIATAAYLPDAIEALINLGRLDEAEVLVDRLERNGRRLDRAWMLAVGCRCRAMLNAALGELDAAADAFDQAMAHHDRLPMPFERARTQLAFGQLQRRRRRKDDAHATLAAALAGFEAFNTPLWADRTRAQLARTNPGARSGADLTPAECAVAELAATGMNNRDVAASLFISPKTVEANLARVYRKLNIHSRAELGRHMGQFGQAGSRVPAVRVS